MALTGKVLASAFGFVGGGAVTNLTVKDNQITHVIPGTYYPTYTMGIYTCGIHNNLDIRDNFASGAGAHPYFGVYMDAGATNGLTMEGNYTEIDTVAPIHMASTITGKRNGLQAQ